MARRWLACSRDILGSKSLEHKKDGAAICAPSFLLQELEEQLQYTNNKNNCIDYQLPLMLFDVLICPIHPRLLTLSLKFLPRIYPCINQHNCHKYYK